MGEQQADAQRAYTSDDSLPSVIAVDSDSEELDVRTLENNNAPEANRQQGMDNLCSLVESLIRLKQKDHARQLDVHSGKRAVDNSRSPTASTVSISDALDLEIDIASSSCEENVLSTRNRNALNLSASIQASPPRMNTVSSPAIGSASKAQTDIASSMHAARIQQASRMMHWQRASMAYARQLQAAQYQLAATAYSTQAARYRQTALNQ